MRKIGVTISKGGTGKTTTAVNLAAGLAVLNKRVLLIDTDTQGQAGAVLGISGGPGLGEFLREQVELQAVIYPARENLWVIPGGDSISNAARFLVSVDPDKFFVYLSEKLSSLNNYDFVILDSGPGWDQVTTNVIFYVDEILAPVSMEALSVQSLADFIKRVERLSKVGAPAEVKYILPTFVDGRVKKSDEIYQVLQKHFPGKICDPVRYNVRLSEAPAARQTIFEYDRRSTGAADYAKLIKRILENG